MCPKVCNSKRCLEWLGQHVVPVGSLSTIAVGFSLIAAFEMSQQGKCIRTHTHIQIYIYTHMHTCMCVFVCV